MKIVSNPPKTGEEFLVCYVDSDVKVKSYVMKWDAEWNMFVSADSNDVVLHSDKHEKGFFKGATILVSKGD